MQVAALEQLVQHHGRAAHVVHVACQVLTAGAQVGNQGGAGKDLGHIVQMELDAGFVRNGRNVQRGVGGAAGGRDHGTGVLQGFARHDVARERRIAHHGFHQLLAGAAQQRCAFAEDGGHHAGADRRQAQRFRHHAHGVGGELAGTGAGGGQAGAADGVQLIVRGFTGQHLANGLVGVDHIEVAPVDAGCLPGQGRAAVHKHAGHIAAHHAHHQTGQVLVAGADAEDAVPLVAAHRGLHAVGNQFARNEREAHAGMRHGQAIRHRDHRALVRCAAGGVDAGLGVLRLFAQIQVARAHLATGVEDADVGPRNVLFVLAQRVQKAARGGADGAFDERGGAEFAGWLVVAHGVGIASAGIEMQAVVHLDDFARHAGCTFGQEAGQRGDLLRL